VQHPSLPDVGSFTGHKASRHRVTPNGPLGVFDDPTRPAIEGLKNQPILVVEDEVLVSMDIEAALEDAGAQIVGPAGSLAAAADVFAAHPEISGAILDVSLNGEDVYPLAVELAVKQIPIVFHTGHAEQNALLARFPNAAVCVKPVAVEKLLRTLSTLMRNQPS